MFLEFGSQLAGGATQIAQGATMESGSAYDSVDTATSRGKAKGEAIGSGIGTLISPIVPFAPAVGKFIGGLLGGNSAQKKAEMRQGHLKGRRDNISNMYSDFARQQKTSMAKQDVNQSINDNLKANVAI